MFEDRPDYGYLRRLFKELFARSGYENDLVFDWTNKAETSRVDNSPSQSGQSIRPLPTCRSSKYVHAHSLHGRSKDGDKQTDWTPRLRSGKSEKEYRHSQIFQCYELYEPLRPCRSSRYLRAHSLHSRRKDADRQTCH